MAAVAEDRRINELRRLGLSKPLLRLAAGECIHEMFRICCLGPPYYVYHGADTPDGPPLVPLWDSNDTVVGIWEHRSGLEFVDFSVENTKVFRSLSRTEQGFWAIQFDFLYECEASPSELQDAAMAVDYRFLSQQLTSRESAAAQLCTFDGHRTWLRQFVADIDRQSS